MGTVSDCKGPRIQIARKKGPKCGIPSTQFKFMCRNICIRFSPDTGN